MQYKGAAPEPLRDYICDVNQERYGDPLSQKFEDLMDKYSGDYDKIFSAAKKAKLIVLYSVGVAEAT